MLTEAAVGRGTQKTQRKARPSLGERERVNIDLAGGRLAGAAVTVISRPLGVLTPLLSPSVAAKEEEEVPCVPISSAITHPAIRSYHPDHSRERDT